MSASRPVHEPINCQRFPAATNMPWSGGHDKRTLAQSSLATSVVNSLHRSGKWAQWQQAEPRLAVFDTLEEALEGWRRRDTRCYEVVAGLTAIGSRRGGDDDDAALAVTVLLEDGVNRVATTVTDVWETTTSTPPCGPRSRQPSRSWVPTPPATCFSGPGSASADRPPAWSPGSTPRRWTRESA